MAVHSPCAPVLYALISALLPSVASAATIVKVDRQGKTLVVQLTGEEQGRVSEGAELKVKDRKGREWPVTVKALKRDRAILDASKAPAGQRLKDRLTLVAEAPAEPATDDFGFTENAAPAAEKVPAAPGASSELNIHFAAPAASPALGHSWQNRTLPGVMLLEREHSEAQANFGLGESKIDVDSDGAKDTLKGNAQTMQLEGTWVTGSQVRVGARLSKVDTRLRYPDGGGTFKTASQDISLLGAFTVDGHLGFGVELLLADRSVKGEDSDSASFQRILPSISYTDGAMKLVGTWRPPVRSVDDVGVMEGGYLRADGLYKLTSELLLTGQLTRNFYEALDSDSLGDTFDLKLGARLLASAAMDFGAEAAYYQQAYKDKKGGYEGSFYGGYGLTLDGALALGGGHNAGAFVSYDKRHGSPAEDVTVDATTLGYGVSYKKSF